VSSSPSKVKLVTDPSAHWREFGLCHRRLFSAARRLTQIGSWWLTHTASWPRAASRPVDDQLDPGHYLDIGLTPGRRERVPQVLPVQRVHREAGQADGLALEHVPRLDEPVVGGDLQTEAFGHGLRGLLRALQRGREDGGDRAAVEVIGGGGGHHPPVRRQVVPGQSPVQHVIRVMHFTVPQQVNDSDLSHGEASLPARYRRVSAHGRMAGAHLARAHPSNGPGARVTGLAGPARRRASGSSPSRGRRRRERW
jgi:hypothetical protein